MSHTNHGALVQLSVASHDWASEVVLVVVALDRGRVSVKNHEEGVLEGN